MYVPGAGTAASMGRGQKVSKVIETAANTLRILAVCRSFLKRLLPFERESRPWESSGKKAARGVERDFKGQPRSWGAEVFGIVEGRPTWHNR